MVLQQEEQVHMLRCALAFILDKTVFGEYWDAGLAQRLVTVTVAVM
jgi:hypothetical protein